MADSIRFEYAVYLLPGKGQPPASNPLGAVEQLLAHHSNLKLVEDLPQQPREMLIQASFRTDVQKKYAPPDIERLKYAGNGLSRRQATMLEKSKQAIVLDFAHPKEKVWTALRTANALVEELARNTGGLIWDEETREVFTPEEWRKTRQAGWIDETPDISKQVVIHFYPTGEYARAITLGMAKVGLPDVVVQESPQSSFHQVGDLIDIFSQAMAEGAALPKSGNFRLDLHSIKNAGFRDDQVKSLKANARSAACLVLKPGKWEEGDPKNRLIELSSDRYSGPDMQAKQSEMLDTFFGWKDLYGKVQHTQELLEASRKAREKLPELRRAFNHGLEPGEYIEVKAPFPTPQGDREWMWVEVSRWKGARITGTLDNEPVECPDLHAGQVVQVREEDVFDYIRKYSDGRREGNTTGKVLEKQGKEKNLNLPQKQVPKCE